MKWSKSSTDGGAVCCCCCRNILATAYDSGGGGDGDGDVDSSDEERASLSELILPTTKGETILSLRRESLN